MGHVVSMLACLLAALGTMATDSAVPPELQEYRSAPDWAKPPLPWAFAGEGEADLHFDLWPLVFDLQRRLVEEPLPPEVAASVHKVVEDSYRAYLQANDAGGGHLPMARLYGPVFRFDAPEARILYVFTLHPMGFESEKCYYFLLFDPKTRKVTKNCPYVWTGHMESALFCGPLAHFFDVNLDGRKELVVQEVVRNGTMYNAAIYSYCRVTENMDLVPLLALEARVVDLYSDERGLIIRTLDRLGPNRLRINVALQDPEGAPHRQELGTVILQAKDSTSPFEVVQKNVQVSRYADCLLTASGIEERAFLKEGYRAGWDQERAAEDGGIRRHHSQIETDINKASLE